MTDLDIGRKLTWPTAPVPKMARWTSGRQMARQAVLAAAALAVLMGGAYWWVVDSKLSAAREVARERLQLIATARRDAVNTWAQQAVNEASRFAEAGFVRMFAEEAYVLGVENEADLAGSVHADLVGQSQYLKNLLSEFVANSSFTSAALVSRTGDPLIELEANTTLPPLAQRAAQRAAQAGEARFSPALSLKSALTVFVAVPVAAPQQDSSAETTKAVSLFTLPVEGAVRRFIEPSGLARPDERVRLLQQSSRGLNEIEADGSLASVQQDAVQQGALDTFNQTQAASGPVFQFARAVDGPPWVLVATTPVASALADARAFAAAAAVAAGMLSIAVLAVLGGAWFRMANRFNATLADQYHDLAQRIRAERTFQDRINETVDDLVSLKTLEGTYAYVNPALGRLVGRSPSDIVGDNDDAIFGPTAAHRIRRLDDLAQERDQTVSAQEVVHIHGKARHFQFREVPFHNPDGHMSGIVSVATDVTTLIEAAERQQADLARATEALARAVEGRDPYLAGHSKRVSALAGMVVEELTLPEDDKNTVILAARLSQIGKLYVPERIVSKRGRLTAAEFERMKAHVGHLLDILEPIQFELPVKTALAEMHERLDGDGYPYGLSGAQISLHARILAVADWFCARIEPRSYRDAISPDLALSILREQSRRYDPEVVEALARAIATPAGERVLAELIA